MTKCDESLNDLTLVEDAYLALLRLSPMDSFRLANQSIYARLRDEIAADREWDAERVQDYFEEMACSINSRVASSEIRLLTPEGIEAELLKHPRYLQEPLTGNERRLLRDILALVRRCLRTSEPVSVKAIADNLEIWSGDVKHVLEEAGVPYVE